MKNKTGTKVYRALKRVDKLNDRIDRRSIEGKQNADYQVNIRLAKDGESRVWTFK